MKSNDQIIELIKQRKFDSVRYAAIERLKANRLDAQAWTFLGQAMVGLKRGRMAKLCIERAALLDPFANWVQQAWSEAEAVGDGREDKAVLKLLEIPHVTVSACILTRDSSRTIRQCIEALQGAVDEIVVVDTGSTDDTVSIVESFGIPVHHFEWRDDFAAARNYALSLVTSDWAIAVDSDEILDECSKSIIRSVAGVYHQSKVAVIVRTMIINTQDGIEFPSFMGRMFRANSGIHWRGRIHEFPAAREDARIVTAAIRFRHDGYDPKIVGTRKSERNIAILRLAVREETKNAAYHYFLGRELMFLNQYEEAENSLRQSLNLCSTPEAHSELVHLLALRLHREEEATSEAQRMTELYPDFPDGWGWLAVLQKSKEHGHKYVATAKSYRGLGQINPQLWVTLAATMPEVFQ